LAAAGETLFGLVLGLTVRLTLQVFRVAGDLVSHEMGLNLAHQMNPATGESTPLIGYLYESVGTVLFFALGAHHALLRALFASFDALPAGRAPEFERLLPAFLGFGTGLLEAAFRMAAPAFFALLLVGVVLAFLAKVAPQWHLIDAGYPLRAAVGLVLIGSAAPVLLPLVDGLFARLRADLLALVAPV
jgi:flagellar biosynthetic protein FliR